MNEKKIMMSVRSCSLKYAGANDARNTLALDNVSLTIYDGDFVCILGPSGCGKSTLLNIMAGLLEVSAGTVEMRGELVKGVDPRRAVVFQTPTLYPWLDVYKNIAFGPKVRGLNQKEIVRRTEEYLHFVGLDEFAHSKPYELSGGMRQRVALARALVNDPEMILLDEPFGALDAFTRNTMQNLIRDVWKKTQSTCVMITHDVDEALTLATRVVAMSASPGRIVQEFPVDFTLNITNSQEEVRYSPEYINLRKKILKLIGM